MAGTEGLKELNEAFDVEVRNTAARLVLDMVVWAPGVALDRMLKSKKSNAEYVLPFSNGATVFT